MKRLQSSLLLLLASAVGAAACAPRHRIEQQAASSALSPITCVAVLPFENLSEDAAAGDAMADLVATELLRSGRFQVMDRSESARILATRGVYVTATSDPNTVRTLGEVLGVQAVVMGTVSEYGYRVPSRRDRADRATVAVRTRLLDIRTGDALWGASFAGSPVSFFGDSTGPMLGAAQRVAADLTGSLVDGAGSGAAPAEPCWEAKAQSVLAMLAPGAGGRPQNAVASASVATSATAEPAATPAPLARPAATPAPQPQLSAAQIAVRASLKPGEQIPLASIEFDGLSANLKEASAASLADLAAVLKAHPETRLKIESHVDPTDAAPVPLSQKRAEAVAAKLIALGAPASTVEPRGMGGSKSLFPSFVEAMKAKNRRVEIAVVTPPAGGDAAAVAATASTPDPASAAASNARVKVLASKGASAAAVKLANQLKQKGSKVIAVAAVPEARRTTLVYYTPAHRQEAERLAAGLGLASAAKTAAAKSLGRGIDVVILVGADLK